jgi:acyl carrier protein
MTEQVTFDAVASALRGICQNPLPDLTPETYLDELPGMDSLRVLHVVAMMEEQFGVEIDVAALDRLQQVQDVVRAVGMAQSAASGPRDGSVTGA